MSVRVAGKVFGGPMGSSLHSPSISGAYRRPQFENQRTPQIIRAMIQASQCMAHPWCSSCANGHAHSPAWPRWTWWCQDLSGAGHPRWRWQGSEASCWQEVCADADRDIVRIGHSHWSRKECKPQTAQSTRTKQWTGSCTIHGSARLSWMPMLHPLLACHRREPLTWLLSVQGRLAASPLPAAWTLCGMHPPQPGAPSSCSATHGSSTSVALSSMLSDQQCSPMLAFVPMQASTCVHMHTHTHTCAHAHSHAPHILDLPGLVALAEPLHSIAAFFGPADSIVARAQVVCNLHSILLADLSRCRLRGTNEHTGTCTGIGSLSGHVCCTCVCLATD